MADTQAFKTAARVLDKRVMQYDKNKDQKVEYNEFSALKIPGLEDEKARKEAFNSLANPKGVTKDDFISLDDLQIAYNKVAITTYDRMDKAQNELALVQAKASQTTVDLFKSAGGQTPIADKYLDSMVKAILTSSAGYLKKNVDEVEVLEFAKRSANWNEAVKFVASKYGEEQKKIFSNISVTQLRTMVDAAKKDKVNGSEMLSALDYSITTFAGNRADLASIKKEIKASKDSYLSQSNAQQQVITQIKCEVGQDLIKALESSKTTKVDKSLVTAYDKDKSNPNKLTGLVESYSKESNRVLSSLTTPQLVTLFKELEKGGSEQAYATLQLSFMYSGLSQADIGKHIAVLSMGNKPNPLSEKIEERLLTCLGSASRSIGPK